MAIARRWRLRPCPDGAASLITDAARVSPLLGHLLAVRGVTTPEAATAFLGAKLSTDLRSPMLFRQMPAAAERVTAALARGERIGIHGDYDVDGVSGAALLARFLRSLGNEPVVYIPQRLRDGYGLKEAGVRQLAAAGVTLMVTVDCGGVSHHEIALAKTLGIDTIVCDHHQVSGTPLPAVAVLNPIEADAGFPFKGLCGAGVAFYLALGVRMHLRARGVTPLPDVRRHLDLVALGTLADIVPLVEENRVLVKYGLREIMDTDRPGIVALKAVSAVEAVSTTAVSFRLAPRLNAGGRLADAMRSFELLTTDDVARATELAAELDGENRSRQEIEREILADAIRQIDADPAQTTGRSITLASTEWHPGVIGIVASRLVERYYRPTVLIAIDPTTGVGRGSGRSIDGLDLHGALRTCADLLDAFGGHYMAIGLTICGDRIGELRNRFESAVRAATTAADFSPVRQVDAEIDFARIGPALIDELAVLEPHGPGNPAPVFLARNVEVVQRRLVGENGSHLRLTLRQNGRTLPAIGFGMGGCATAQNDRLDILFSPQRNEWNGATTTQLRLRALRAPAPQ
ncbi:single-stranded-DNA-specific exonuclease RecJ [Candidatus Binatia bacterium]|nr:single-stranded-DNA-specific exonuclease RecJ [Candidatus Binatia bacterium]